MEKTSSKRKLFSQSAQLALLTSSIGSHQRFTAKSVDSWIGHVCPNHFVMPPLGGKITRDNLWKMAENPDIPTLYLCMVIMAWGGLSRKNGRLFFACREHWLPIAEKIRLGEISNRGTAFEILSKLRSEDKLKGVRAAFFTKLICFLNVDLKGYIMDQWTAKSINMFVRCFISLNGHFVSDFNSAATYELFCQSIEALTRLLKQKGVLPYRNGFVVEELLFSHGGKQKGLWRKFVVENYFNCA